MSFGSFARSVAALLVVSLVSGIVGGSAQESVPQDLHSRLEEARANIESIQADADTVEEQIASIDEQAAAVSEALAASRELVARTEARIGVLHADIADNEKAYAAVQDQAEEIAVSLYKSGPTAEIELLLSADTIAEIVSIAEYSRTATQNRIEVVIKRKRLESQLVADRAELEVALAGAIEARTEQKQQAQHLRELRVAQTTKLSDLTARIEAQRDEAASILAASAEVEEALASSAPASSAPASSAPASSAPASGAPAPTSVGGSGFAWPVSGAITSGFGPRWGRLHSGIDIDCVTGAPIRASKSGTIVSATYDGSGYGYYTVIDNGGGFATLYAHMSEQYISGGSVSQGETIGACGSTGASTGDHLHFEIRVNGTPQDPLGYLP